MPNTLKIKRGAAATIPQGQLAEPLFTTDTYDLYIGKGSGGNQRIQNYIASGTSSQFLKGDGTLDSTTYQATSEKGQNNGYASLDAGGKIPAAQLPSSVIEYKGTWNASTNTPTLADGTGDAGDVYIVSVGGTQNLGSGSITFDAGDWVMYNGSIWQKSTGSNAVASVNGQTGIVSIGVNDLDDATITSPSNGQLLQYSTGTNKWVNWTPTYISAAITSLNGLTGATQTFATGTTGTDFGISSAGTTHTFNLPIASATNTGKLSSTDWTTFNNKQAALTNPVTGTGTNNEIAYFNTTGSTIASLSTATYPSLTELSYVKGVTSAIQTQLDGKLSLSGGTMTGQIVLKEGTNSSDYTKGLRFPNDPYGGGSDTSGLRLYADTGVGAEAQVLELYVTNDIPGGSQDRINFYAPNNDLVTINGNKIWNAGNLTPQTQLNGTGFVKATGTTISYDNNTYLTAAITSLNGLTAATQTFATGTTGTDFNISSTTSTHTFNIPSASASNRGLVTTGTQTFAGDKTFSGSLNGTSASFTASVTTPAGFYVDANTYLYEGILRLTDLVGKKNILQLQASSSGHYITSLFLSGGSQEAIYISAKSTSGQNVIFNTDGSTTFSHAISGTSATFSGTVGIGTATSPAAELQVGKASDVTIAMSNSSSVTSGNRGSIAWYNSAVSTVANIRATAVTDNVGTELQFFTRPAAGSLTQVFTLASTGAATFSSTITAATLSTIGTAVANQNVQLNLNGVSGKAQRIEFQNSGVQQWLIGAGAASETSAFEIFNSTGVISLSINKSTNAATFSSSVTANGTMQLANDGDYGSTYKMLAFTGNTNGSHRIFAGTSDDMYFAAATSRGFAFRPNGGTTTLVSISTTGALSGTSATFSGNLAANSPSAGNTGEGIIAGTSFKIDAGGTGQKAKMYVVSKDLSDTYGSGLQIQFANQADDKGFGFNLNTTGGYELYTKSSGTWGRRLLIEAAGAATFSSSVTATAFIPTGSTVPVNGMYSPATNKVALSSNTKERFEIQPEVSLTGAGGSGTGGATTNIGTTSWVGILTVSIETQACAAIFIINAGNAPVLVAQTTAELRFSITSGNANTANVYVSGSNIVLENNIQATRNFYVQFQGKF